MRQGLRLHPDSVCSAATHVDVDVARPRAGRLILSYTVIGTIADLRLPPGTSAARTDGLWRHTCFEAFVRVPPGTAYYEFNFAPSTQWAAYRFDRYRHGMRAVDRIGALPIVVQASHDRYALKASLELDGLPDLPPEAAWSLALSAVIEEQNGRLSYWALAHPPGPPDFHHADCFVHALAPAVRA